MANSSIPSRVDNIALDLSEFHKDNPFIHTLGDLTQSCQISKEVSQAKYFQEGEHSLIDMANRVVQGLYFGDSNDLHAQQAFEAITCGLWIPAGRILSGAGTDRNVTLQNCYVNAKIEDSMESILQANTFNALTLRQGGGMGTDFSTIRPKGAVLKRLGPKAYASGPLPFMDGWDAWCSTIMSAGERRGAMMGTLCDTHPDLLSFIEAKHKQGRLTNFNVSILISDAFMEAIREDEEWVLYFKEPPSKRESWLLEYDFVDDETSTPQYAYSVHQARDLWEKITKSTYTYSEPGVIFIDRINDLNNLHAIEDIRCTNPCGEQPLPPHGACNLASVNLALMVTEPFTARAEFNFDLLRKVTRIGQRFLDYVINASKYPLREQVQEQINKRRTGLGFTGLADCYAMLGIRYGSLRAADLAERISQEIALTSYETSIDLAEEFGFFPLWPKVKDTFLAENTFAGSRLPPHMRDRIRKHGIRNALCNTQAPTGTTSVAFGNISSGIEPNFSHTMLRKVRQGDDTFKEYRELSFTARTFAQQKGIPLDNLHLDDLPSYMVTMKDISIEEHVHIQSRVQRWVDASVSKTINIPTERTYEEFVRVYELAYTQGCKGCTTYRPSEVRGSILSDGSIKVQATSTNLPETLGKRPQVLKGETRQVKWPSKKAAFYVTINNGEDGKPREMFMTSKDSSSAEWTTALSLMITAIFRRGGDVSFVHDELKQIMSVHEGYWIDGKYYGSLPAYLGHVIEVHMNGEVLEEKSVKFIPEITPTPPNETKGNYWQSRGEPCPKCEAPALIRQEGCKTCTNCGYSDCN
jgi:ribonucleoside-diphosphate reductase alpha chain